MRPASLRQSGASLVEVMISVTLGLVLLAALLKSYGDSKATFRTQDALARVQENARYAVELIGRDLRMSGYRACARDGSIASMVNTLNSATDFLYAFDTAVQGYDGDPDAGWTPLLPGPLNSAVRGTDVLMLRGALDEGVALRQPMANTTSDVAISGGLDPAPVAAGDIVMLSDCLGSAIFQVTQFTGTSGVIRHDSGNSPVPGNRTRDLGRRYPMGAGLFRVGTISYYIREGNSGRSLWRKLGSSPSQELVEGVQDMQLQFGLDHDGDRMPDAYINAAAVADFNDVISVRIALLFRSLELASTDRDGRNFTLLDRVVGPFNDGRMYLVMTSTITLRNKAI